MKKLYALNICDVQHLCYLLGTCKKELELICGEPTKYYLKRNIDIKGKIRPLSTPQGHLREILKKLNALLQRIILPENIHGGIRGHSHITNALLHIRKPMVIKNDLKDFFPSVKHSKVYNMFVNRLGCKPDVARYLTRITTLDGCLPQGSPTSTIISALVAEPITKRLEGLAKKHASTFTQYVDDITFSGPSHLSRLNPVIKKIVKQEGLKANPSKTKEIDGGQEQVVTGIRVNQGIDAPSEKIREVRNLLDKLPDIGPKALENELASIKGKIRYITRLNRGAGHSLKRRLARVLSETGS